ncbi:hypothetical protein QFC22_002791 [Naganishia vaughanmartiniae]|uniref:Uncharacterized protein n=1 Tax=Naganishia vaughanmartiniae TaxID=1424756 RepID=A0ACC2XDN8_9TREE|nr:hypothetical protein QFC22_002791 [Naganishia vaughanmartiniae]
MEIVIPNLGDDDDEDLPLPQFPGQRSAVHGAQQSVDSNSSSPKRSASPLIRRLRGDSSASSRTSDETAFAFPQSSSRYNLASNKYQGQQRSVTAGPTVGMKSPTRPMMKPRSGSSASESPYGDRYLPGAAASNTSIHSIVMPAAQPTKKSSFANLKNAFKAAASAMERSSSSANVSSAGASTHGSSSGYPSQSSSSQQHPLAQQHGASNATASLPALRNPFMRSFSSSAVSLPIHSPSQHHQQPHYQPSTHGSATRVTPSSYNTSSKPSSGSSFMSGRKSKDRDRAPPTTTTATRHSPGMSHAHKFSHVSRPSGHTVTTSSTSHSSTQFAYAGVGGEPVPMLPVSYAHSNRRTPVTSPSAKTAMLAGMGTHGAQTTASMAYHHARAVAAAAAKAMPAPRSPNEIVMHELFRHFVAQSDGKVESVLAKPLMHQKALELLHEGEDPLYDNLLHSLAACAKEFPKHVINFVAAWGQMQSEGLNDDFPLDQPSSSRYQEYMNLVSERKTLAGRFIVYRLLVELFQSDAGAALPEELTQELEESMFEAYAAEDSAYIGSQDRKDVVSHCLAGLKFLSADALISRFVARLDSLMDGSYPEQAVLGKIEHLLRGLYHVFHDADTARLSEILSTLAQRLSTASNVSWKATIAESITLWLEPRSLAMTNLNSEAWHEAVTAITQQAERLVAEPGLWTAVFPLVVICLCFAPQTEFDQLWRFRLEQAMGMLQSPQHQAYHEIALRNVLRLVVVASLRDNKEGQVSDTVSFLQNLLFPTIATLDGFGILAANALEAMRPSALDLQLPTRHQTDIPNESSKNGSLHNIPVSSMQSPATFQSEPDVPDFDNEKDSSPVSINDDDDIPLSPIEFDEKDDTLGDLVGALHSLNEFFSAEDEDVDPKHIISESHYDLEYDQTNEGRVRAILARSMRRGSNEQHLNWHLANIMKSPADNVLQLSGGDASSGSDGLDILDEQSMGNSIQQQISSWRLANQSHRARPSMSSLGSFTRDGTSRVVDSAFDLEDDSITESLSRDAPRSVTPLSAQSKKTGRLKNLVLASGSRFSPTPR